MTFKVGQWVVVNTAVPYWPAGSKTVSGPFRIQNVMDGLNGSYAVFPFGTPNNAYFKDLTLYKPQVGDKVKILKPMSGYTPNGDLPNTVGTVGTISYQRTTMTGSKRIRIDGWGYLDEEDVYELVEPKGSINPAASEPPSTPVVKPTKRVLNGNV